jgi:hypothetical protein
MLVVFYQCETWSPTLREIYILGACENTVLWKVLGPKEDKIKEAEENCVMRM